MNLKSIAFLFTLILASAFCYSQNTNCAYGVESMMTPPPTNCTYSVGDSVVICFDVTGYVQSGENWIHGFVFDIGKGWDTSSIHILSLPFSCSGTGYWGYFPEDSSYATDSVFGQGIYYDYNTTYFPADGIPGDNYGDGNTGNFCFWSFCLSIKVGKNCGSDLHFGVRVTPDGLSGSWVGPPTCTSNVVFSDSACGANITSTCDTIDTHTSTLKELTLHLYPDPANSTLTIGPIKGDITNAKVSIYSLDGRAVQAPVNIKGSKDLSGMIYVNTSELLSGMYLLSLTTEDMNVTSKFSVMR